MNVGMCICVLCVVPYHENNSFYTTNIWAIIKFSFLCNAIYNNSTWSYHILFVWEYNMTLTTTCSRNIRNLLCIWLNIIIPRPYTTPNAVLSSFLSYGRNEMIAAASVTIRTYSNVRYIINSSRYMSVLYTEIWLHHTEFYFNGW